MIRTGYLLLCFLFILFSAMTCEDIDEVGEVFSVTIDNSCNEDIYIIEFDWPDNEHILSPVHAFELMPNFLVKVGTDEKYEAVIEMSTAYPSTNYQFLIFKQSTLDKYTKEELIEKNIFDKRYSLTYEELEKMNFKIVYTGE